MVQMCENITSLSYFVYYNHFQIKSGDNKSRSFSESLLLDDSEKGVIITGITDDKIAAKSGLQAGNRKTYEFLAVL